MVELRSAGALVLLTAALVSGCGSARVSLGAGPRNYVPDDYPFIQQRWTRKADGCNGLLIFSKQERTPLCCALLMG